MAETNPTPIQAAGYTADGTPSARVTLPAAPSNHPDKAPLRALDAMPKTLARPMTVVAGI